MPKVNITTTTLYQIVFDLVSSLTKIGWIINKAVNLSIIRDHYFGRPNNSCCATGATLPTEHILYIPPALYS